MQPHQGVRLQKSGPYWQLEYRDDDGNRRFKSLQAMGPRSKVPKSAAQAEADKLAKQLATERPSKDTDEAPTLADWIDEYLGLRRAELAPKTLADYLGTCGYLKEHFGPQTRCSDIKRADADRWRAELLGRGLADETVRKHARRAITLFRALVVREAIPSNPFDHLPSASRARAIHGDVDASMIPKLIEACPDRRWRALMALTCYAGLRRGESLDLQWSDVKFGRGKIVVHNAKTAGATGIRTRDVKMEPELEVILAQARDDAGKDESHVVGLSSDDVNHGIHGLLERAGIPKYPKPLHSWRSWRSKSWKAVHPEYIVNQWMGHSSVVAAKHYSHIDESVYTGESELDRLRRENAELREMLAAQLTPA